MFCEGAKARLQMLPRRDWNPYLRLLIGPGATKLQRCHPDDGEGRVVQNEGAPDHLWIEVEPVLPERIADHRHIVWIVELIILLREHAANRCANAQHRPITP